MEDALAFGKQRLTEDQDSGKHETKARVGIERISAMDTQTFHQPIGSTQSSMFWPLGLQRGDRHTNSETVYAGGQRDFTRQTVMWDYSSTPMMFHG